MRTVLNIVWFLFSGLWLAIGYAVAGVICCILIITIPFGIASFRIAGYVIWPFGRTVVEKPSGDGAMIGNIIWLIFAGVWIAMAHIGTAIALCCTIIGIPLAIPNIKMLPLALMPLGKQIIDSDAVMPHYQRYAAQSQYR